MEKNIVIVVRGLICAPDGEILLVTTHKWKGLCIPGGKIEHRESIKNALHREILEETSLTITRSIEGPIFEGIEDFCTKHFITFNFICFLPSNCYKNSIRLNEELTSYLWVQPKEALDLSLTLSTRKLILWYNKRFGSFGKIGLEKQAMPARIGVFPEEKTILQTIEITLHTSYNMQSVLQTDDIVDAINYMALLERCREIAISKHFALLETLAQSMIDAIFTIYSVQEVELSIYKIGAVFGKNSSVHLHKIRREALCLGF